MNPINVGIVTGALLFIALLQGSIIVSEQSLSPNMLATGQNLYSSINIQGIAATAFIFGALCAVLEIVWPGTGKKEKAQDEEMGDEDQESLDDFDEHESRTEPGLPSPSEQLINLTNLTDRIGSHCLISILSV
jgi:hypothetical protein